MYCNEITQIIKEYITTDANYTNYQLADQIKTFSNSKI